jgi:hypothetical protein
MKQESNLAKAYLEAYEKACLALLACDSEMVCQNTKAVFEADKSTYVVRYFNQEYRIKCTDGSVVFEKEPSELSITEQVLVLHYLINAKPRPLTGRTISFLEVPKGGSIYHANFKKRAVDPLVNTFSGNVKGFMEAGVLLGGSAESFGDASITVFVFPFVPITYVLWEGEDEIPPSGTILFDTSIPDFLPAEDIVLAASYGTYKLIAGYKK